MKKLFHSLSFAQSLFACLFFCSSLAYADRTSMTRFAQMYLDFEMNNAAEITSHPEYREMLRRVPTLGNSLGQNIEGARIFVQEIEKMKTGEITPNTVLTNLFEVRFVLLDRRYKGYQEYQNYLKKRVRQKSSGSRKFELPPSRFIPSDPEELESLKRVSHEFDPRSPVGTWNLMAARLNTDRYQTINTLIRELVRDITPEKLSKNNLLWTQCSVSLHPFLTGATENPGFPDQACLPLKKPGYFPENQDDYSVCSFYVWPSVRLMVTNRTTGRIQELIVPGFESIKLASIPFDESKHPKLPELAWPTEVLASESPLMPEATLTETPSTPDLDSTFFEKPSAKITSADPISQAPQQELLVDPTTVTPPVAESRHEELSPTALPPRGVRVHHPLANRELRPSSLDYLSRLKTKDLQWLKDLFAHEKHVFQYRDFQRVWQHINGENSIKPVGGGGSHRQLLNDEGKVVSSIFTHGDSQSYGTGYLGYLISSFSSLGISKEAIDASLN